MPAGRFPAGSLPRSRQCSRGLSLAAVRDELLAAVDMHLLVVRNLLELSLDDLVELVLHRYAKGKLQRASGVLAARDALQRAVQFDFDELALALLTLGRVDRFIRRLHM